jgi:hypothetical protein
MSEDRRAAKAALCVSAVLLWIALPEPAPRPAKCPTPVERGSRDGWTLSADCAPEPGERSSVRGPARRLFGLSLDPNHASPAALETLPGIGPSRAAAIVESRKEAPFCRLSDLDRIRGIGPRTLEKLSGLLEVDSSACPRR